ncbi:Wzz/FepE/Etk N-terminal domain-containing protein [Nocardioides sp. Soil777]|uniref:Wzz/FepE/Etk N-terminal domain-containing protein n=1 Tax=Nocardioides sp. Soil777 TaxID=1736409 RepID=UPI000B33D8D5|nr:Wzz/FepE/Etk N-terminal domain-containing protein [Nocardioides sp. Soil777]
MKSLNPNAVRRTSLLGAVRRHVVIVIWCLVNGAVIGWLVGSVQPATYSSTAHVLVNPTVGNPFAPTPVSVRQDELTSLETEAQVAQSAEVLTVVAAEHTPLTLSEIQRGVQITVPANTQILEMSYSAKDPSTAQQVTDTLASAYLANRQRRSTEVNDERIARVETQTQGVVDDLRDATVAAQTGTSAERLFQTELAAALRNELVSLRAQRSYLENSDSPTGSVISPASPSTRTDALTPLLILLGGALGGLALGVLMAWAVERFAGRIRTPSEVETAGLPVVASVDVRSTWARLTRPRASESLEDTMRRLRGRILDLDPVPEVIAVTPAGSGAPDAAVTEALAESFAKAGHRVVLVRTHEPATHGLEVEGRGLAEALLHERLNILEMLQPSIDPLLCLLPWGLSAESRELLDPDRLRNVLRPLVDAGHLVVLQAPGIDGAEGEAVVGAADLGLVVVTARRTPSREIEAIAAPTSGHTHLAAVVVGTQRSMRRARRPTSTTHPASGDHESVAREAARAPR